MDFFLSSHALPDPAAGKQTIVFLNFQAAVVLLYVCRALVRLSSDSSNARGFRLILKK